jgi:hypothetical protein
VTHPMIDSKSTKRELTDHIVRFHLTAWSERYDQRPFTQMTTKDIRSAHDWLDRDGELDKHPRQVRAIMGGSNPVVCICGNDLWIEFPRTLDFYDYACSKCGKHISPMTETGASR